MYTLKNALFSTGAASVGFLTNDRSQLPQQQLTCRDRFGQTQSQKLNYSFPLAQLLRRGLVEGRCGFFRSTEV